MSKQQQPNKVNPADNDTRRDRNENGKNQSNNIIRFEICRPANADFDNPVNARNQKQNELHQKALFIKPFSHKISSKFYCAIIILCNFLFVNTKKYFSTAYKKLFFLFRSGIFTFFIVDGGVVYAARLFAKEHGNVKENRAKCANDSVRPAQKCAYGQNCGDKKRGNDGKNDL